MNKSNDQEMTNCEEYRQRIAADPAFDGGAGHLAGCTACQAFRAEMQSLDSKIARALQINAPAPKIPELPAIKPENVVVIAQHKPVPKSAWFALAASVMLAALIGVRLLGVDASYGSLAEEVLAHLDHEPAALQVSNVAVSDRRLGRVVPASVATMNHDAGLITYARSCNINGHTVPHLVIQGAHGPITLLLMPEEAVAESQTLDGDNIHGVILPVGNGSIAIIGAREEDLTRVEKSVLNSVSWRT